MQSIVLTSVQKDVRKEFRAYLRCFEQKRGIVLNAMINAAENHLPVLIKAHLESSFSCLYDNVYTVNQLLQFSSKLISKEEIWVSPFGYMSLESLKAYIRFYTSKNNIELNNEQDQEFPEDDIMSDDDDIYYSEGSQIDYHGIKYERDSSARKVCIEYYKCRCNVCGMDFEKTYGELGKDFIEVHHLIPISQRGGHYILDPIHDLRPLCSNCHSMIHRKRDASLEIDELKKIIDAQVVG